MVNRPGFANGLRLGRVLRMAAPAHAGNYVQTYGKQVKARRDAAANLKSFGDLPSGVMEWPINPALKLFKKPNGGRWTRGNPCP